MQFSHLLGPEPGSPADDPDEVRALLEDLHPEADIVDPVSDLEPDEQAKLMNGCPQSEVLPSSSVSRSTSKSALAERMPPESVAHIASEMEADDRADFFSVMPEKRGSEIFARLEKVGSRAPVRKSGVESRSGLETSAGHLVTTRYACGRTRRHPHRRAQGRPRSPRTMSRSTTCTS